MALSPLEKIARLTNFDLDILQLIAQQNTTRDISLMLNLSVNHIEATINQMMIKLEVRNLIGLIIFAGAYDLISPPIIEAVCNPNHTVLPPTVPAHALQELVL